MSTAKEDPVRKPPFGCNSRVSFHKGEVEVAERSAEKTLMIVCSPIIVLVV
jgi:hypothetical protein